MSAAVLLAAACGTGSGEDATTAGQPVAGDSVVPVALTGLVVAGNEAGWVVDRDGAVWRVDVDGAVERIEGDDATIPMYNRGFSTFVEGKVVFAGTRCDGEVDGESCDGEAVVELRLLDEGDQSVEVVEIARAPGGRFRSVGAGVLGVADGAAWVSSDTGEVVTVDAEGEVTSVPVPPGAESQRASCMVGGELYGIRDATSAGETGEVADAGGPTPTIYAPGTQTAGGEDWTVDRWDGAAWAPVAGGTFARDGLEAMPTCTAQGFVVHPYGVQTPIAVWTVDEGWQQPAPTIAPLRVDSMLSSTTKTLYTVADGRLQRVDLRAGALTATPLDAAALAEPAAGAQPPTIDVVDDAGRMLIACGGHDGGARCVVTPDS